MQLVDDFNVAFGGWIFYDFSRCLLSTIICLVFVSSVYEIFYGESTPQKHYFAALIAVFILCFVVNVIRLARLTNLGQVSS